MEEDFESFMKSQLRTLKNQMKIIKDYINRYEERSFRLRRTITNELIDALIKRFERNEELIQELNERLESLSLKLHENLSQSVKELREEISEAELSKAISKIFEEKKIKVSSKALEELKKI
ncbi:MAG: hypothetical protein GTN40_04125 [Candidatus Aenigmarchaeota archaeon]|nr:hypothetical protein [Candidatus Aenigmarchaeota archaeon]